MELLAWSEECGMAGPSSLWMSVGRRLGDRVDRCDGAKDQVVVITIINQAFVENEKIVERETTQPLCQNWIAAVLYLYLYLYPSDPFPKLCLAHFSAFHISMCPEASAASLTLFAHA